MILLVDQLQSVATVEEFHQLQASFNQGASPPRTLDSRVVKSQLVEDQESTRAQRASEVGAHTTQGSAPVQCAKHTHQKHDVERSVRRAHG